LGYFSTMRGSRLPNILMGLAILSLVLGAGNLIVGSKRSEYYHGLRQTFEQSSLPHEQSIEDTESITPELKGEEHSTNLLEFDPFDVMELDTSEPAALISNIRTNGLTPSKPEMGGKTLEYIEARYNFYRFCVLGGKCMLAAAGAFLFLWLLVVARSDDPGLIESEDSGT